MSDPKSRLAAEIHASADLMCSRDIPTEALDEATALVERANALLASGEVRSVEDRMAEFASQMIVGMGAPIIEEGAVFEAFTASPYSGKHNPMRPTSASYTRVGDDIHGEVLVGAALEGAPGRAHGGLTAAVFDDIMGALQRVTGISGYTRTLTVNYLAKLPIDETVHFEASLVDHDHRTFTIDALARHGDATVATACGIFTTMATEAFTTVDSVPNNAPRLTEDDGR